MAQFCRGQGRQIARLRILLRALSLVISPTLCNTKRPLNRGCGGSGFVAIKPGSIVWEGTMFKSACLALFVILIAGCGSAQTQFGHGYSFGLGGYAPYHGFPRAYDPRYGSRGYSRYYRYGFPGHPGDNYNNQNQARGYGYGAVPYLGGSPDGGAPPRGFRYSCRINNAGDSCIIYTSTSKRVGASCKCHKQLGSIE
jgi:hypothetical protein